MNMAAGQKVLSGVFGNRRGADIGCHAHALSGVQILSQLMARFSSTLSGGSIHWRQPCAIRCR